VLLVGLAEAGLARPLPALRTADLAGDPWRLQDFGPGSPTLRLIARMCAAAAFEPRVAFRINDCQVILAMVAAGEGVSAGGAAAGPGGAAPAGAAPTLDYGLNTMSPSKTRVRFRPLDRGSSRNRFARPGLAVDSAGRPMARGPLFDTDVSARLWHAVADPARVRIIAALRSGPLTPDSLASRTGLSRASIASHVRALENAGFVQVTREGSRVRYYELATSPRFSDEAWEALPAPVRRAAAAAGLVAMNAAACAAVDAGGFDRADMHLTRSPLMLDETAWKRISQRLLDLLDSFETEQAAAAERLAEGGDDPVDATAIMMLFTTGERERECEPLDLPRAATELELHEHAYDLAAELDRAISGRRPDWARVIAMADQLRLVARVALAHVDDADAPRPAPQPEEDPSSGA
jgi:DNA-binding transcriptional ArsR family regulator